jgi:ABC-type bacteriocin/lantibiotic exporter with double-glycine peptidase domain
MSNQKLQLLSKEELTRKTKVQWMQSEILYGILTIKSAGLEEKMLEIWEGFYQDQLKTTAKKEYYSANLDTAIFGIRIAAPLFFLCMGTWQVMQGHISMGSMIAFYTLTITFFLTLSTLVSAYQQMVKVSAYLSRMGDVLDHPVEDDETETMTTQKLNGQIHLEDVSFRYAKYSPLVLQNIHLSILPGQKVAIVGKSGAGKSTLAHLLIGLYPPTSGKIFFDGQDIDQLHKPSLRKQIGMVPQHIHMFNRTIYENITLLNPEIKPEMVIKAAQLAQIHEDIIQLPLGYQTVMSEFGTNFSGGQKQRIALARALVHQPSILLLDEATSSLDSVNEAKVDQYLSEMNCTRIVIAHRLSTVQNADLIVVLGDGKIVEQGKHEELLQKKGHYSELYETSLRKEQSEKASVS